MPRQNTARLPRPLREFLATESSGGLVLLAAAVVALVWANSPWRDVYERLWHTELVIGLGSWSIEEDLRHWVNDLLMAVFFFVVGMEIKRELVEGELRVWRTAALPAIAALGGMVVPALLYVAVNAGSAGSGGWGIPMATDIAFALGVVALLGRRVPPALKLFLLTLAIVDDIGAIVVIAVFYSDGVNLTALAVAAALLGGIVLLRRFRLRWVPAAVVLGMGVWLATFESGVHATIAGVVLGLLVRATPIAPGDVVRDWVEDLEEAPGPGDVRVLTTLARDSVSPAERLQHDLHPWTSFLIVPLFALANAGVDLSGGTGGAAGTRVVAGVILGLVVGKLVGISAASWLAVRLGIGRLPEGVSWHHIVGAAGVAGIGFTVSLFIAGLAFDDPALGSAAKIGVLVASVLASAVGAGILIVGGRRRADALADAPA